MYRFYIDESGKPDLRNIDPLRPHFFLAGVIVHNNSRQELKIKADQIKFKYWGHTNIVFHAQAIRQITEDFQIFKNPDCKFTIDDFYKDFSNLLNLNYKIGIISINKSVYIQTKPELQNALLRLPNTQKNSNWFKMVIGYEKNLLKMAATELLTMYIYYLNIKKARGEVVVESCSEAQDMDIFSSYNKILISGFPPFEMNTQAVRQKLTGISFVTKHNHDIEEQLADIAAHYLNIEARKSDLLISDYVNKNDEMIIKIIKSKTFLYKDSIENSPNNSLRKLY